MRIPTSRPSSVALLLLTTTASLLAQTPVEAPKPTEPKPAATPSVPATVPASATKAARRLEKGDQAPAFTIEDRTGKKLSLADFAGKIVIVDVQATWCGPCQAAMPNNDRVQKAYQDQGVVLLAVCTDDSRDNYKGWVERNADKYSFTLCYDTPGREHWAESVFNKDYGVTGFPTMFVIGRDGKLVETVGGGGPGDDFRLDYALARAGAKVDLAKLPPEPKRDPGEPKSIPMIGKTPAMPAMGMATRKGAPEAFPPARFGTVERGQAVPDFAVEGSDGKPLTLASLRGKRVLLQFHTGNGPQAWLETLAKTYAAQNVTTVAVFAASERAAMAKWSAEHPQAPFAVAWDKAGTAWAESVTNTHFGVGMYPATTVIDADGKLVSGTIGMGDKIAVLVRAMLQQAGVELTAEDKAAVTAAAAEAEAARKAKEAKAKGDAGK